MFLAIQDIPLFKSLSSSELEAIKSCLREKTFQKGDSLFMEGECCERVFIVRSGRVKLYRTASSGREQTLETLEVGDTCACNPGSLKWDCQTSAEALAPSTVWFLNRNDYVRMVQTNSKLSHALNQLFAERLAKYSSLIEEVSLKDVKKRLVKFLLDMLQEHQSKSTGEMLFLPFTREEIAQRLGTVRETVARYLSQLESSGLIQIKPKQIVIKDKKGLEKLLS
jgi:CRP/FNR family transcriptional regulator